MLEAEELDEGALQSSATRWNTTNKCRDLVALRCRHTNDNFIHACDYLRIFSKKGSQVLTRLRFNRSDLRDSQHRRGIITEHKNICDRCDAKAIDTPKHFFLCSNIDLTRARARFRQLSFYDTDAMLGEHGLRNWNLEHSTKYKQHMLLLSDFYEHLRDKNLSP